MIMRIINIKRRYYHLKTESGEVMARNVFPLGRSAAEPAQSPGLGLGLGLDLGFGLRTKLSTSTLRPAASGCVTAHKMVNIREYAHNALGDCTHISQQDAPFG